MRDTSRELQRRCKRTRTHARFPHNFTRMSQLAR